MPIWFPSQPQQNKPIYTCLLGSALSMYPNAGHRLSALGKPRAMLEVDAQGYS